MVSLAYQWYHLLTNGTNCTIGRANGTIGITIGTNGITNGTTGKTLNDIGIPLVPLGNPKHTHFSGIMNASHHQQKQTSLFLQEPEIFHFVQGNVSMSTHEFCIVLLSGWVRFKGLAMAFVKA